MQFGILRQNGIDDCIEDYEPEEPVWAPENAFPFCAENVNYERTETDRANERLMQVTAKGINNYDHYQDADEFNNEQRLARDVEYTPRGALGH